MTFTGAVVMCLQRSATFSGRASRGEFWSFLAFYLWLWFLILALMLSVPLLAPVYLLVGLSSVLPMLSVTVRRLHDVNRSALWLLLALVPVIGSYALSLMLVLPGSKGPNDYGLAADADVVLA